jgi:ATP-dependent Clp protease protease subunit
MYIPTIVDKSSALDIYSRMLEKGRLIFLSGPIDDNVATSICAQILYLVSESKKDILLYINSPGGVLTSALAIYDTIQFVDADVSTCCLGQAASAAALLLAAGTRGKRRILTHGRTLIHQPLVYGTGISGQQTDIKIQSDEITRQREESEKILARHTGQTLAVIKRDMERDTIKNAQQSVEYGLVDEIIPVRDVHNASRVKIS